MNRKVFLSTAALAAVAVSSAAHGQITFDGTDINNDAINNGLTLLATQDAATGFGNSAGTDQSAPFGSELNALYAGLDGTNLTVSITGNLEANFNKFFLFFDGVAGGENVLAADNADGGFGEINSFEGLTFADGATMDHGLRFEIGGGFYGINSFDLIDNTAASAISGAGTGDLPLTSASGGPIIALGWDNSNALGVSDTDGTTALTATQGWEFQIDLLAMFGEVPTGVGISAIITNGGGDFASNQALPGLGDGAANLGGDYENITLGVAFIGDPPALLGDLDLDGDVDVDDIDILGSNVGTGTTAAEGDLDNDGDVDTDDLAVLLGELGTVAGDANLDQMVDTSDLAILAANFGTTVASYGLADYNLDTAVNTSDLAILAAAFGFDGTAPPVAAAVAAVPEPATLALLGLAGVAALGRRRA
ncbi:MAG: PEP-CTERM sorting domain-containing protein [Planctomycetota bacterium]